LVSVTEALLWPAGRTIRVGDIPAADVLACANGAYMPHIKNTENINADFLKVTIVIIRIVNSSVFISRTDNATTIPAKTLGPQLVFL
jgi:hypothetical protein